jgi:hypothetical protein
MSEKILIRELTQRERRRMNVHGLLPVDAIDPLSVTRDVIEQHQTKFLYRYGCELKETMLSIQELENNNSNKNIEPKRNLIFHLRGFFRHHRQNHFPLSLILFLHLERIRNHRRRSTSSLEGDSIDEKSFIFEPLFTVCAF